MASKHLLLYPQQPNDVVGNDSCVTDASDCRDCWVSHGNALACTTLT